MDDKIEKIMEKVNECDIKFVRLQFVDIHGAAKNMAIPLMRADQIEDMIKEGILFDGSSIEGFVDINESDLVLKPEPETFSTLPWRPE
ncbi:MAG: glutamine synthetase beta-grasp domain-containing protein, partial [Methanobacteriales archaeon]|nr:glutamine synthetase beta-grasp domain-containing protein [Methanobacteriales archaeon]MBC7119596.1 glutamine synthetase beta-grasp domain-containing protein [Methanobacteriaceae archaeon]